MSQTLAYNEVIDYIAAGNAPDAVSAFRNSAPRKELCP